MPEIPAVGFADQWEIEENSWNDIHVSCLPRVRRHQIHRVIYMIRSHKYRKNYNEHFAPRSRDHDRIIYETVQSWLTMKWIFSKLNPTRASSIWINRLNQQKVVTRGKNLTSDPLFFLKQTFIIQMCVKEFREWRENATEWCDVAIICNLRIFSFLKSLIYLEKIVNKNLGFLLKTKSEKMRKFFEKCSHSSGISAYESLNLENIR